MKMNKSVLLLAILSVTLTAVSCGQGKKGSGKAASPQSSATVTPARVEPTIFDRLSGAGKAHMLSPQILTSEEAYVKAFENGAEGDYFGESTPVAKTFLLLDEELRKDTLARLVQLHYNYASVLNRVIHSYEWYSRAITDIDEDTTRSRQDTLDVIRESQPVIPQSLLRRALPDEKAYRSANRLLAAYRAFDGDESDDSLFSKAYRDYLDVYAGFPEIVTDKQVSEVKEGFWKWYDKSMAVPGINDIVRVHMRDSKEYLDSLQVDILKRAAEAEHDLERRAVLALELVQFDHLDGAVLLGDIMGSGIYTKYLLEVWLSWRANVQMEHSPSSFSVIANNYYDMLRVQCLKTYLRRLREDADADDSLYDKCMMVNLIQCEILHRMASIAGNESFATRMHLAYDMFIHPSLLEQ